MYEPLSAKNSGSLPTNEEHDEELDVKTSEEDSFLADKEPFVRPARKRWYWRFLKYLLLATLWIAPVLAAVSIVSQGRQNCVGGLGTVMDTELRR